MKHPPAAGVSGSRSASGAPESAEKHTTLESFVAQLHEEGVVAGRREAERLRSDAEKHAGDVVRRAEADAARIVAEAEARAGTEVTRARAELEFAVRDALIELRSAVTAALQGILREAADARLRDPEFLVSLIRGVVMAYATGDASGKVGEVRVPREMKEDLVAWTIGELADGLRDDGGRVTAVLADAGFEYRIGDGTVEVSPDAIREKLTELVSPHLRDLIAQAASEGREGGLARTASSA